MLQNLPYLQLNETNNPMAIGDFAKTAGSVETVTSFLFLFGSFIFLLCEDLTVIS